MAEELFNQMRYHRSQKSCKVDDIVAFFYGPVTSRFWVLRKHICMLGIKNLSQNLSFYAWDCLTISVKDQEDICLIVKDETKLMKLVQFLIFKLQTVDGKRDTALPLIKQIMREEQVRNQKFYHYLSLEYQKLEKKVINRVTVMTLFKYKVLRVRYKLSYHALIKRRSVMEHIIKQIISSFRFLKDSHQIILPHTMQCVIHDEQDLLNQLIWSDTRSCLCIMVIYNLETSSEPSDRAKVGELLNNEYLKEYIKRQNMTKEERSRLLKKEYFNFVISSIGKIQGREKCYNLFKDIKIHEYKMFQPKIMSRYVKYKGNRLKMQNLHNKLSLLILLRAFSGFGKCIYPELLLKVK